MSTAGGLVTVAVFSTPAESGLARSILRAAGITTFVDNEQFLGWFWHYGVAVGGIKLSVSASDADSAREILAPAASETPIVCQCGETLPPGFEVCWKCEVVAREPIGEGVAVAEKNARVDAHLGAFVLFFTGMLMFGVLLLTLGSPGLQSRGLTLLAISPLLYLFLVTTALAVSRIQPDAAPQTNLLDRPPDAGLGESDVCATVDRDIVRALLAALLGLSYLPIVLNLYSIKILGSYLRDDPQTSAWERFLIASTYVVNACVLIVVVLFVLVAHFDLSELFVRRKLSPFVGVIW